MRILLAVSVLAISAPALADKPAPPFLAITPGAELELPTKGALELYVHVRRYETSHEDRGTTCTATQGAHHVDGTGDRACKLVIDPKAGFVAGPVTLSARTRSDGEWSEPSTVEATLVPSGNMYMQANVTQNAINTTATPSATLANGTLSFALYAQNGGDNFLPTTPYLGRVTISIPANGKIDQVVAIDERWLEPLAKSSKWTTELADGQALLTAKALHITGTYSKREGADLKLVIPGDSTDASISFKPNDYTIKTIFVDCGKMSGAERRQHPVCN